jgi:hypothetical protein
VGARQEQAEAGVTVATTDSTAARTIHQGRRRSELTG